MISSTYHTLCHCIKFTLNAKSSLLFDGAILFEKNTLAIAKFIEKPTHHNCHKMASKIISNTCKFSSKIIKSTFLSSISKSNTIYFKCVNIYYAKQFKIKNYLSLASEVFYLTSYVTFLTPFLSTQLYLLGASCEVVADALSTYDNCQKVKKASVYKNPLKMITTVKKIGKIAVKYLKNVCPGLKKVYKIIKIGYYLLGFGSLMRKLTKVIARKLYTPTPKILATS